MQVSAAHEIWRIIPNATNDEAYAVLKRDRIGNCFAIADLLPPFRQYTRIALALHPQTGQWATLLIVEHPEMQVLSLSGHAGGVAALLAQVSLPSSTLIQAQPQHWPLLAPYYTLPTYRRELLRMAVSAQTFQRPAQSTLSVAERMTVSDLPALRTLYTLYATSQFRPSLIEEGLFYGMRVAQRLVAAGGTHVIALPYGLAVLGHIFTHPEQREHGYAQAVTSTLVADLLAQGCQDVILNVDMDNAPALHIYTKLGFQQRCYICSTSARRR